MLIDFFDPEVFITALDGFKETLDKKLNDAENVINKLIS
jgi:hypothetical protein